MAKLDDIAVQLQHTLNAINDTNRNFSTAKQLLAAFQSEEKGDLDLNGVGLALTFANSEQTIPLPLPEGESLVEVVSSGAAMLSQELVRLWGQVHALACEAKQHCDAAVARTQAQQAGS